MAPELAARTTVEHGYATPNAAARNRLPAALADDPVLFPSEATLCRCHLLRDLGAAEPRLAAVYRAGTGREP
jgi:spermidine/putrescine transport system substrate-binding protein